MKHFILILICTILSNNGFTQIIYESPSGVSFKLGVNWKEENKVKVTEEAKEICEFTGSSDVFKFDAFFQKSESDSIEVPYVFFLTTLLNEVNIRGEMGKVISFLSKNKIESKVKELYYGKIPIDIEGNKIYVDSINNIIIASYNISIGVIERYGVLGFCFEKNSCEQIYCFSEKDQINQKKEFIDIIYSKTSFKNRNAVLAANYYNEGIHYAQQKNYKEAIIQYTKAIENYPLKNKVQTADAYYNRGNCKKFINDPNGAILDYTVAVKLNHNHHKAFNNRGYIKIELKDYKSAIEDFNKTIAIDNYKTEYTMMALGNRGIAKINLKQDGCSDLKESKKLGNNSLNEIINQYCK